MKKSDVKLYYLIKKAKKIRNFHEVPISKIISIQFELEIVLNCDFHLLSRIFNHEFFTKFDWGGFPDGIIKNTKTYRNKGLPNQYVILADEGDAGFVLMETQDSPDKPSPIIWCDYEDMFNLCAGDGFKYNPDIWPSFVDFFEYLVSEEEKRTVEEE